MYTIHWNACLWNHATTSPAMTHESTTASPTKNTTSTIPEVDVHSWACYIQGVNENHSNVYVALYCPALVPWKPYFWWQSTCSQSYRVTALILYAPPHCEPGQSWSVLEALHLAMHGCYLILISCLVVVTNWIPAIPVHAHQLTHARILNSFIDICIIILQIRFNEHGLSNAIHPTITN